MRRGDVVRTVAEFMALPVGSETLSRRQCAGLVWHRMPKVERAKDARTGRRTFEPYGHGMGGTAPYYFRQCTKMQEAEMCAAHSGFYVRSR